MLKMVVFDVGNGSCALIVDKAGNSLMIDCGCHSEKVNPVTWVKFFQQEDKWLQHMKKNRLSQLIISHPDLDHIKNAKLIHKHLTPKILTRRYLEEFPQEILATGDDNYKEYKRRLCDNYRVPVTNLPNWGFVLRTYKVQLHELRDESIFPKEKFKNNSSIVCVIEHRGWKFLFGGDMEKVGWKWLIENRPDFKKDIAEGIGIFIASHHGHKSGYSQELMNLMGEEPKLSVLSKGSESGTTDVESRYSKNSSGWLIKKPNSLFPVFRKSVTTRHDGNVYFQVDLQGNLSVCTEK